MGPKGDWWLPIRPRSPFPPPQWPFLPQPPQSPRKSLRFSIPLSGGSPSSGRLPNLRRRRSFVAGRPSGWSCLADHHCCGENDKEAFLQGRAPRQWRFFFVIVIGVGWRRRGTRGGRDAGGGRGWGEGSAGGRVAETVFLIWRFLWSVLYWLSGCCFIASDLRMLFIVLFYVISWFIIHRLFEIYLSFFVDDWIGLSLVTELSAHFSILDQFKS